MFTAQRPPQHASQGRHPLLHFLSCLRKKGTFQAQDIFVPRLVPASLFFCRRDSGFKSSKLKLSRKTFWDTLCKARQFKDV